MTAAMRMTTPSPPISVRPLLLALCFTAAGLAAGCGSAGPSIVMHDAGTLRAERIEYRGASSDRVILRRGVHAVINTAVNPSDATSHIVIHTAVTRFSNHGAPERVAMLTPDNATLTKVTARLVSGGTATPTASSEVIKDADGPRVDPAQTRWELVFPPLEGDAILEVVAAFDVPGTLVTDARFLRVADAPTRELLLRYDIDSDAVGAFGVAVDRQHRPVVTEKDGRKVIALLVGDQPARGKDDQAHARYVTTRVSPKNFTRLLAATWPHVAAGYARALLTESKDLRQGYAAPFASTLSDRAQLDETYGWVRDRIQPADAMTATWENTGPLVTKIEQNTLTQTDKVHLLRWLLDEAGIPSVVGIARPNTFPATLTEIPAPGTQSVPIVYVPAYKLWLDPACQTCEAGTLRAALQGAQVITLPATNAGPTRLP
ncbi:MAG: hypothetical protein ACI9MR_004788 [Myxococcota bacterium]|jgi:hypothetical protein